MSISTYFRPNIHQNGPEILGVNMSGVTVNSGIQKLQSFVMHKIKRSKGKKQREPQRFRYDQNDRNFSVYPNTVHCPRASSSFVIIFSFSFPTVIQDYKTTGFLMKRTLSSLYRISMQSPFQWL
jgi:hypothetical protein